MLLYFLSIVALCTCLITILILKFTSLKQLNSSSQHQQGVILLSSVEFLKLLKKSKPFPVGHVKNWWILSCHSGSRVWTRKLTTSGGQEVNVIASFIHLPSPAQVVHHTLKDVSKTAEWKPGVETATFKASERSTPRRSSSWMDTNVGVDQVLEIAVDPVFQESNIIQMYERLLTRHWFREENGCCWILESDIEKHDHMFYLLQPLEDVDTSLLTILSCSTSATLCSTVEKMVSSYLHSLRNYIFHRKLRATPFVDLKIPSKHHTYRGFETLSSSDDEEESNVFQQKFFQLHPEERSAVIQKSESILKLSPVKACCRQRTFSDNMSIKEMSGSDKSRPRSQTHPHSSNSAQEVHSKDNNNVTKSVKDADNISKSTSSELVLNDNGAIVTNTRNKTETPELLIQNHTTPVTAEEGDELDSESSELSESSSHQEEQLNTDHDEKRAREVAKNTTLANQVAAELLALVHRVSNLDLKASPQQQQDSTGGWMFCGFESDVVIIKRQFHNINLSGSYIGKGIIQTSPQAVMDAVKNPRTRYTYDDSLKRVDILQHVTEKIKIVYYSNEVLHKFKKYNYDWCVIQSERQDGEKLVLSMESVETDLPIPAGVNRIKILPSGWIIEPVIRDNKTVSLVTYVMQMNYGLCSDGAEDKVLIDEMVSKQPLSIAYLRQYLRPPLATARRISPTRLTHSKKTL
ncbi:uncharacterized protein LOC125650836 [Ostrea edulis]|uniref:uncharacterized protein LOC125650836 n=1 Tax=Ostrea edulis TaxID=37623 RepID=UPI0020940EA4|nr:uncharacterized protein LOC125650836 [Ostrea edulis]